ncbi:MAG: hypothetical protein HGA45_18185 [Chloroflexales bacterium]|nr:hypothetical protein [Chloroflexales bacterium]
MLGFLLMLATETLYSPRKRARGPAIGRLSTWLQWHVVMGIVGAYMVLLHTAWQFQGLAGVVTLKGARPAAGGPVATPPAISAMSTGIETAAGPSQRNGHSAQWLSNFSCLY